MSVTTQNLIIGKKESVEEKYLMLDSKKIPLLSLIGISSMPVTQTTHNWLEDILISDKTTLATTIDGTIVTVVVAAGDGILFRVEDVITIAEESMRVTAVVTDTLTVERSYRGTTGVAHTAADTIYILGQATVEGSIARESRYKPRQEVFNYTEILKDTIQFSDTSLAVSQYGFNDFYSLEQGKVELTLFKKLERNIIQGVRFKNGDSTIRYFGGMRHYIQSNVIDGLGTKVPDLQLLKDMSRVIWENGGFEEETRFVFVMSPVLREIYSNLQVSAIRTERLDGGLGNVAMSFVSEYSPQPIMFVTSDDSEAGEMFLTDLNRIMVKPLQTRSFSHKFLGTTGDRTEGEIVGEYTIQFEQESAHTRAKNLKID